MCPPLTVDVVSQKFLDPRDHLQFFRALLDDLFAHAARLPFTFSAPMGRSVIEALPVHAGQPTRFIVTLKDDQAQRVRDLQVVYERPIHLLVISDDLEEFYHLHLEQAPDGSFRVMHTFPHGGHYNL